ncbi:HK97 family phage prohead protease [Pseudaestuariivita sp.]|uniref:HK97 family phage prohead protease n=1 Tax=Pseudaestuariivita sp. TaxID=2211669 RepID=UPI00405A28CC
MELERKFCRFDDAVQMIDGVRIEGYASLFGVPDQGSDIVAPGAYARSLAKGRRIKMLWQHDPAQPIGVWHSVVEDTKGLKVAGQLLETVEKGREAAALVAAGAIEGLSIGYRTVKAHRDQQGRRVLTDVELWEVSLVTFPMLPDAQIGAKAEASYAQDLLTLKSTFTEARKALTYSHKTKKHVHSAKGYGT